MDPDSKDAHPFGIAHLAADQLAELSGVPHHDVAVILGSGWVAAADRMGDVVAELPMTDLAGFRLPLVAGHASQIRSIASGPRHILAFLGRIHLYEGHGPAAVVHAVRTAVMAGCRVVVLTNAAGAINTEYSVGQAVLIADHINLTGQSPLTGPTPPPPYDARFVDMSTAYSPRLRQAAHRVDPDLAEGVYAAFNGPQFETPAEVRMAGRLGADMSTAYSPRLRQAAHRVDPDLAEGVYAAFNGPQFETPAEVRMAGRLGADLAGMSTVLETIAARQMGAEVLGCSLVTNMAAGLEPGGIDHQDVMAVGRQAAERMGGLLAEMIDRL